jgi:hypothetical protein
MTYTEDALVEQPAIQNLKQLRDILLPTLISGPIELKD